MKTTDKIRSALGNPAQLKAYTKWWISRSIQRRAPFIHPSPEISIGEWISFSEYWSFQDIVPVNERLLLEKSLQTVNRSVGGGGVAFDLGANVGAFTCFLASQGNEVHSFEPIPETFSRLKRNVQRNGLQGKTHLNCLAVGERQELVRFDIREDSPATNRMAVSNAESPESVTSHQVVAATTLDAYCDWQKVNRIDFLKIDVEGMEPMVLRGARRMLREKKVSVVMIEICPNNLRSVGLTMGDLYEEIRANDYHPRELLPDGTAGALLSLNTLQNMVLANIVLTHDIG